jgi:hypothetical protein
VPTVSIEARPTIHTHSSEKRQLSGSHASKARTSRGSGLADRRVAGKMSGKDLESLRGDTADGPFFWKIGRQRIHPIES